MKQELRAVNYYRHTLLEGCAHGFHATGDLCLRLEQGGGAYLSPMLDSGGLDATYNRLIVQGDFAGVKLEVIVAATNSGEEYLEGRLQSLEEYLAAPHIPPERKAEVLTALPHVRLVNTTDLLLHSLTGRYLWIYLSVSAPEQGSPLLEGMRLELPRHSFTQYFPEIYQGNQFFNRYIAVFQSLYLDMERQVDGIPGLLDYRVTQDRHLEHLAGWLGIDNSAKLYTPEQLRYIIDNLDLFQGGKGTRRALPQILRLLTGLEPRIVEQFQWDGLSLHPEVRELWGALYGATCDDYCVLFDLTDHPAPLPLTQRELEKVVEDYSVIGARFRIVYLRPECHLDTHCYLDINGSLSTPEVASIGSAVFGVHITVG